MQRISCTPVGDSASSGMRTGMQKSPVTRSRGNLTFGLHGRSSGGVRAPRKKPEAPDKAVASSQANKAAPVLAIADTPALAGALAEVPKAPAVAESSEPREVTVDSVPAPQLPPDEELPSVASKLCENDHNLEDGIGVDDVMDKINDLMHLACVELDRKASRLGSRSTLGADLALRARTISGRVSEMSCQSTAVNGRDGHIDQTLVCDLLDLVLTHMTALLSSEVEEGDPISKIEQELASAQEAQDQITAVCAQMAAEDSAKLITHLEQQLEKEVAQVEEARGEIVRLRAELLAKETFSNAATVLERATDRAKERDFLGAERTAVLEQKLAKQTAAAQDNLDELTILRAQLAAKEAETTRATLHRGARVTATSPRKQDVVGGITSDGVSAGIVVAGDSAVVTQECSPRRLITSAGIVGSGDSVVATRQFSPRRLATSGGVVGAGDSVVVTRQFSPRQVRQASASVPTGSTSPGATKSIVGAGDSSVVAGQAAPHPIRQASISVPSGSTSPGAANNMVSAVDSAVLPQQAPPQQPRQSSASVPCAIPTSTANRPAWSALSRQRSVQTMVPAHKSTMLQSTPMSTSHTLQSISYPAPPAISASLQGPVNMCTPVPGTREIRTSSPEPILRLSSTAVAQPQLSAVQPLLSAVQPPLTSVQPRTRSTLRPSKSADLGRQASLTELARLSGPHVLFSASSATSSDAALSFPSAAKKGFLVSTSTTGMTRSRSVERSSSPSCLGGI